MPDIVHDFSINAPRSLVFVAVATPQGLDSWWTLRSNGAPVLGAEYELWFGPSYDWRARVTGVVPDSQFELQISQASADWLGTRIAFRLEGASGITKVRFAHSGWPRPNDHYRASSFCWAMYLRLLKRNLECGEIVPYDKRLDS
ncbi:MAG: SRPBCC domain-containing protein [Acidobacteria bacterium]|nr:SRPBCC domain-containing protein [Acidobacteriota bacterium]